MAVRLFATVPVLAVSDVAATIRWYSDHLGFSGDGVPKTPPHNFGIISRDNIAFFLQRLDGFEKPDTYKSRPGGVWNVYVNMNGVRELYETVSKDKDVTVLQPIHHQEYGQTEFVIRDINNYAIVFAEAD